MKAVHFGSAKKFAAWLRENHAKTSELCVGFYKRSTGKSGISYAEALDEALCYGWIDGVRAAIDSESYKIRFTPRKGRSIWSRINVRHVERLKKAGRMTPAGLKAYAAREKQRTGIYSFEQKRAGFAARHRKSLRANEKAWAFFRSQAPWYQRTAGFWVSSAKQKETQERRLAKLIEDSANGRRLAQLTPKAKRAEARKMPRDSRT